MLYGAFVHETNLWCCHVVFDKTLLCTAVPRGPVRCFHRICEDAKKENMPGRCPNCRAEFGEERIRKQRLDPAK